MSKKEKDVLQIIQDRCDPNFFDNFETLYPDQQWRHVVQELNRKGIMVVPDYKDKLSTTQEELSYIKERYVQAVYYLKSLHELYTGAKTLREKSTHKLLELAGNLVREVLGSKDW